MNKLVYLFELDSVRKSEKEVEIAQGTDRALAQLSLYLNNLRSRQNGFFIDKTHPLLKPLQRY